MTRRWVLSGVVGSLAIVMLAASCGGRQQADRRTARRVEPAALPPDPAQPILQERIERLRDIGTLEIGDAAIASARVVSDFYENRTFRRAWTDSMAVEALFRAINESRRDGLEPTDYHYTSLSLLQEAVARNPTDLELRSDFDLLLTDALVRLGHHILFGKVDPERLDANWNMSREIDHLDPAQLMEEAIASGELFEIIEAYKPQHPLYVGLKDALDRYRAIAAAGGWPSIPDGPALKFGVVDPRVPLLRQRLALTGDLATAVSDMASVFDSTLVKAVEHFQHRHALLGDGEVGRGTLAALNTPVETRVDQILASLERGRWILHEIPVTFVAVNIAGFRVYFVKDGELVWETRAQVGQAYRETPVFKADLKYLVFNPTWTVPPGILDKDILPAARRDPGSVAAKGLKVLDRSGSAVDPSNVHWSAYTARTLPYTLRQDAGPRNALGRVKFIFPNPHAVFLHDTPSRSLFDRATRTFSSGCVRVEDPLRLAELVLDEPKWTREAIERLIADGETKTVFLRQPIPVLLVYWTASPGFDGDVHFWPDIYARDAAILAGLQGEFRFRERPILGITASP